MKNIKNATSWFQIVTICAAVFMAGCLTSIEAEKRAEKVHPIETVVEIDGTNRVVTSGYLVSSGGWEASASSPIWATEALTGLAIAVHTNGSLTLALDDYKRDLSTNAVVLTQNMIDGTVKLTEKVAAAIVTAGGSTAAPTVQSAISALVAQFVANGGDADNAKVECKDGSCTITDGRTTCTDGSCYER